MGVGVGVADYWVLSPNIAVNILQIGLALMHLWIISFKQRGNGMRCFIVWLASLFVFFFFFFDGWGDFFPPVSIKPHEIAPSLSQHIHQPTDSGNIPAQKFYWKSHASHRDFTHGPSRVFRLRGGRGIKSLLSWDPYDEPMIQTGF